MKIRNLMSVALAALLLACNPAVERATSADADKNEKARGGFTGSAFTAAENLESKVSLRPQAITVATVNGAEADKEDFSTALVQCDVAALGGTSPTLNVKVQEAATSGGTFADVTGAAFTQFTTARSNGMYVGSLSLRPRQNFLRLVATGAGTGPTGNFACSFVFGGGATVPVAYVNAPDFNVR